jgi:hypothetical protein
VQYDYSKFANRRFLRTVHWPTLGRLLEEHREKLTSLDFAAVSAGDDAAREAVADFLLGSKDA